MLDPSDYLARAKIVNDHVKEQLNHKSIRYNWHEADVTVLEGILARGDRKISKAILYVYEHGGIFRCVVGNSFYYDLWRGGHLSAMLGISILVILLYNEETTTTSSSSKTFNRFYRLRF